ncbi:dehydrogenase/reductase SDR family member on chromosome X isoform X2 [Denticeps clupeoides]|nr:dehydrogenase/reductase SDR family member on chromosome X-like isoform X2 [Denticeps clupeoides]XP_028846189.1 dehydrogenase/reductase SDR family member on chromosome X-like isoform X2 [Denticeps clupeoides]
MHVIIASNHEDTGLAAVKTIREEQSELKVEFQHIDLASLKSVQRFVQRFNERGLPLHILINNAAVMLAPERRTEEGLELHFGVNYLGHFLLTRLLLDHLKRSGKDGTCSRIVTVSSSAHYMGDITPEGHQERRRYSPHGAYARSKLALVLFTYSLQQQLTSGGLSVTASAVDPGMVNTDLYRNMCGPARLATRLLAWLLFRTPAQGAATTIYAAAASELEGMGGCYLHNGLKVQSSPASYDLDLQTQLWRQSCGLADHLPEKI